MVAHHSKALDLLFHLVLTGGWREAEGRRDLLCSERFASQKGRRPEGGPESRASSAPREGCRARRGLFSSGDAWPWGCGGVLREKIGPFLPTQMALRQTASQEGAVEARGSLGGGGKRGVEE